MTKWEYKQVELTNAPDVMMTEWGEDGWELVSVVAQGHHDNPIRIAYFKRPKQ